MTMTLKTEQSPCLNLTNAIPIGTSLYIYIKRTCPTEITLYIYMYMTDVCLVYGAPDYTAGMCGFLIPIHSNTVFFSVLLYTYMCIILSLSTGGSYVYNSVGLNVLDIFVGIFATISTILHLRSLVKSAHFAQIVRAFFLQKFNYRLKWKQVLPLFNLWFTAVILGNCLATVGALMKLTIAFKVCCTRIYMYQFYAVICVCVCARACVHIHLSHASPLFLPLSLSLSLHHSIPITHPQKPSSLSPPWQ